MEKEKIDFLLKYAKNGILSSKSVLDDIEYEEIKQKYLDIKQELIKGTKTFKSSENKDKSSAVKNWFKGIGDRQRKYQESHKDDLI